MKIANHFRIGNRGEIGLTYFEVRYFRQTWTDADRRGQTLTDLVRRRQTPA